MKGLTKILLLVGFCVFTGTMAAQPSRDWTYGLINGRSWREMQPKEKLGYLNGVKAVMALINEHLPCDCLTGPYLPEGRTMAEIAELIDRFYDQPENLLIAPINALEIIVDTMRGVPQNEIDAKILKDRILANLAPERKVGE